VSTATRIRVSPLKTASRREIARPALLETTALGAAFLAGLGTGVWRDQAQVAQTWREDRRFRPTGDRGAIEAHLARWDAAVAKC
jgi:glycerol kinase